MDDSPRHGAARQRAAVQRVGRPGRPRPAPLRGTAGQPCRRGMCPPSSSPPAIRARGRGRATAGASARPAVDRPRPRRCRPGRRRARSPTCTALLAEQEPGATAHGFVQPVPRSAGARVLNPPTLPEPPARNSRVIATAVEPDATDGKSRTAARPRLPAPDRRVRPACHAKPLKKRRRPTCDVDDPTRPGAGSSRVSARTPTGRYLPGR